MGSLDISDILERVGSFGRFQKIMFLLLCLPFVVNWNLIGWSHFFVLITPPHQCTLPGINDTAISSLLIPTEEVTGKLDSCRRYDVDISAVKDFDLHQTEAYLAGLQKNGALNTIPCDHGWTFDVSNDITTASSDFLWVCDNAWMKFTTQTVFSIGSMLGMLVFGYISDAYGRFPCVVLANVISPAANLALLLCNNFYLYCVFRFVMGLADYSVFVMPFIILMEYLPSRARSMVNPIAFGIFACSFNAAQPWMYRLMGNWQSVVMYNSIFALATALPAFRFIPESAGWLLTKGRVEKCLAIVQKIAKTNGKELSEKETEDIKSQMNTISNNIDALPKVSFKTALKNRTLCMQVAIGIVLSMIVNIINDGNTRSTENVELSPYIMFTLYSVVLLPSQFSSGFLMARFGRRATLVAGFGSCCVINALIVFLPPALLSMYTKVGLMMLFRFSDALCYTTTVAYLTEILPTVVRARGMAVINCAGFTAMAMGPQLIYLANFVPWLPSLIFSIVGLIGALLTSLLPETNNKPLVQTLEDVERRGFSRLCCSGHNIPDEEKS